MLTFHNIVCLLIISLVEPAKILAVFSFPDPARYVLTTALLNGLHAKGHEVVAVTSSTNERQFHIDMRHVRIKENAHLFDDVFWILTEDFDNTFYKNLQLVLSRGPEMCANVMVNEEVQNLIKTETFDLIIGDIFMSESLLGLSEYFKAPFVGVAGFEIVVDPLLGNYSPSSIVPHILLLASFDASFCQRLLNVIILLINTLIYEILHLPQQRQLYDKLFPRASLSFDEALRNISLVLLDQHFSFNSARPMLPNMIEVAGLHIEEVPEAPAAKVQQFLDDSPQGVVYANFVMNSFSINLSSELLNTILRVFEELQLKVLWHATGPTLNTNAANIMVINNGSRNSILSHRNVKLFITRGELISLTEAIYYAKPILGIPMFSDQRVAMDLAVQNGYGLFVNPKKLQVPVLKMAILELLNNPRYNDTIQQISKRFRDQPMKPLDKAIYWLEYVLRHQGAPHLGVKARHLSRWQYHNVDVYFTLFIGFVFIVLVVLVAVRLLLYVVAKLTTKNYKISRQTKMKIN